jgi:uncharacterized membrane protein YdjX (TVP38/TMEM64 family)
MVAILQILTRHRLRFLTLGLWLVAFFVARSYMSFHHLTTLQLVDAAISMLRDTWYGPLVYIVLYILRPLLLIPGTVLILTAGVAYGLPYGIPITIIANIASAIVTYHIARWFMSQRIEIYGRRGQLISLLRNNPFETVVTMQLSYISLDLTSSLAGILYLPFRPFLLGVFVGGSVGNTLGVVIGSSFGGNLTSGQINIQPEMLALSACILVLSLSLSALLRRYAKIPKE